MHIFITRFPYESKLGGLETITLSLAQELKKRNHTVNFVGNCKTLIHLFETHHFSVEKIWMPKSPVSKGSILLFLLFFPYIYFQCKKIIRSLKQGDNIYMLSLLEKLVLTKMAYKKGIKVFWGEHEALMDDTGKMRKWLAKNPFLSWYQRNSKYATVITVSHHLKQQFEELGNIENLKVIENGIDTNIFYPSYRPQLKEFLFPEGKIIIGTFGRMKAEKGMMEFLEVAQELLQKEKNVHFAMYGDGPLHDEIVQYIQKNNLEKYFSLHLEEIAADHMRDAMKSVDIALFLSTKWETFGVIPLETMALGIPTLLTAHFGFVTEKNQNELVLVDPLNHEKTAEILEELMSNKEKQEKMKIQGRTFVEENFSVEKMADQYEKTFQ